MWATNIKSIAGHYTKSSKFEKGIIVNFHIYILKVPILCHEFKQDLEEAPNCSK